MSDWILQIRSVHKSYSGRPALSDVTLDIPPGVIGLLGPNGSGKSTLIKAILGLVQIDSGHGQVLDLAWPEQVRALRDRVGYLPEDDCYIHGLQGIQSIQMMARLSGLQRQEALRRAHEMADFSDLGQERYRTVETYSTGMRQKLKFAQALVHDPDLIILDEPTTGLDPSQRDSLLDRIRILAKEKNKSIILSTHILHDVQRVCDYVIILVRGRVCLVDLLAKLQRPATAQLSLHVVDGAERLCAALKVKGMEAQLVAPEHILVVGDAVAAGRIWSTSHECGVLVQRLEPARNSLEQTFLDAVKG
ncbi:MAG TPA: ABC transporter ATP-binding protein [Planctomycetaceae bacterium]|nr:ABC transporter ATP-binding protein [Planctomycetaceae bacterium]